MLMKCVARQSIPRPSPRRSDAGELHEPPTMTPRSSPRSPQERPHLPAKKKTPSMDWNNTRQRLAAITDEGLFEGLATAVLRESEPECRSIVHVGINKDGKTIPSPVDGITYTHANGKRQLLAVHHTTSRKKDLRHKWLQSSSSDVRKTLREIREQRQQDPTLRAKLILTTNEEPTTGLVHDVEKASNEEDVEITLWAGSRLAHFLDFDSTGQWIRQHFLGIEAIRISEGLFSHLSTLSARPELIADDPELWVERGVDRRLHRSSKDRVRFVLGDSGVGKTVACLKFIRRHVEAGGFGIVVDDDVVLAASTIEQAVDCSLRRLQPSLGPAAGAEALQMASETKPLLLLIEDINRSSQPARLLDRLGAWSARATQETDPRHWSILCPIWPRTITLAGDQVRRMASESAMLVASFNKQEGTAAVRARRTGITDLEAETMALSLGLDPLLIALHGDSEDEIDPKVVIQTYITGTLNRLAAAPGAHTTGEHLGALRTLSTEMLKRRRLNPRFDEIQEWLVGERHVVPILRTMVQARDVVRLVGPVEEQRVEFRHDRVRDHVLADTIAYMSSHGSLPTRVLAEPYFAAIIGMAIARKGVAHEVIGEVAEVNPLSLFYALRHCSSPDTAHGRAVVEAATKWASGRSWRQSRQKGLRSAVLRAMSECEGPHVRELQEIIGQGLSDSWTLRGRFRNGDLAAGIQLCAWFPPSITWEGHKELIEHVLQKNRPDFLRVLKKALASKDLSDSWLSGALRLAGFVGDSELADVLRARWTCDPSRTSLIADYFWACARCCDTDPASLLGPIVDTWATISSDDVSSGNQPRTRAGMDDLWGAFGDRMPEQVVDYLLDRAQQPDLRPLIVLLLDQVDNPNAIEFTTREMVRVDERLVADGYLPLNGLVVPEQWRNRAVSIASRGRLQELWSCKDNTERLRRLALRLWCALVTEHDLAPLRTIDTKTEIGSIALLARLRRGDLGAVAALVERLDTEGSSHWWQGARHVWTDELTECLDRALKRRAGELAGRNPAPKAHLDWILVERLTERQPQLGDCLIRRHWAGLRQSEYYVAAALHVASPYLLDRVAELVAERKNPRPLFENLCVRLGVGFADRCGITRLPQLDGLLPYLDYLSDGCIVMLWRTCNRNGWYDWRRRYLDSRAKAIDMPFVDDAAAIRELDKQLEGTGSSFALDRWVAGFLESGVSMDHVMDVVAQWLTVRTEDEALRLAANLVTGFGQRKHLPLLFLHSAAQTAFGHDVVENAGFEVRLRSLV